VSLRRLPFVIIAGMAAGVAWADRAAAADPTKQECVVANETAQDLQRAGKLVDARAQLLTCASSACPTVVRQDCADRLQSVEKSLPTVVLTARDAGGGDAAGASLAIDGVAQSIALDGTAVSVDPGPHTFTVTLAGHAPASVRLSLNEGDRLRREVVLKEAGKTDRPGAVPGAPDAETAAPSISGQVSANTTRRIAWGVIGAGAAGITLGTIYGFLGISRRAALGRACDAAGGCPKEQQPNIDFMHVDAVASNISFAVGVLGLAAGGVLLFAFPQSLGAEHRRDEAGLVVRPWAGLGDVGVAGRFR
jgi:hypothetical protein